MVNKKEYVKVLLACVVNQTDSLHRLFCYHDSKQYNRLLCVCEFGI